MLAAFGLLVATTQLLWLSYAPITAQSAKALGVSEGLVGDLAAVLPVVYVLLALPTGRWLDRRFTHALTAGALVTAVGAGLRLVDSSSFAWALAGQALVSIGQPLVLNATTKVAARYFPPQERTTAIAAASAGQFVGILVAALTAETLVDAGGLHLVMLVHFVVAAVAALAVLAGLRLPPAFTDDEAVLGSLGWLRHDRTLWKLAFLLFVGVGVFNAVATWLDTILIGYGHPGTAGNLIAIMTVVGIVGAAVLPGVVARRQKRRELLMAITAATAVGFLAIAVVHDVVFIAVVLAALGFLLLAGLPVALDWSELEAGPTRAGTATGFLLLAGNAGGALLVLVVQALIGNSYLALGALALVAVPGFFSSSRLPRHVRRHGEGAQTAPTG